MPCRSADRTRIACGSSTSADTANRSQGNRLSPPAEMWLRTLDSKLLSHWVTQPFVAANSAM